MADLELLLRDYGDELDDHCPAVTVDEVLGRAEARPTPGSHRRWRVAAAAVVVLVVGAAITLAARRGDPDPSVRVDQPPAPLESPTPTVPLDSTAPTVPLDSTASTVPLEVGPDTWSVAARITEADLQARREMGDPNDTIGEIATLIRDEIDGVEVRVVEAIPASWTAAMGDEGEAFGCVPECLPGIVVWTDGYGDLYLVQGAETVAHWMVSNWAVGLPTEQVRMSATAQAEAWVVAEERHLQSRRDLDVYLASIQASAPEPRFDTSALGTEQLLAAAPEVARPADDPILEAELSDDTFTDAFHATATLNGVIGYVFHPEFSEADDLAGFLDPLVVPMLGAAEPDGGSTSYEFWLYREAEETISSFGTGSDGEAFVAMRRWVDGLAALGAGRLPSDVAVVTTDLPDGTAVWQRPVQRMVIFTAPSPPGFDDHDGPEWTWQATLVGYDADGIQIFEAFS